MGDRASIEVRSVDGSIFLYSHWAGADRLECLQKAMALNARWDDPDYLTRIIFDAWKGLDVESTTSWGISPAITDHEYPLLVVDTTSQTISEEHTENITDGNLRSASFSDFAERGFGSVHA